MEASIDAARRCLRSRPLPFLATFAVALAHGARGAYVEAGYEPAESAALFHSLNEMLIVVTKQIAAAVQEDPTVGYPDDAFFAVIGGWANEPETIAALTFALRRALTECGQAATAERPTGA